MSATSQSSPYVCHCFHISKDRLEEIFHETNGAPLEQLKEHYQVSSRCTSCEIEVKDLLLEYRRNRLAGNTTGLTGAVPWRRRVKTYWEQTKKEIAYQLIQTQRRHGIFVIYSDSLQSRIIISNLAFPEDKKNINGRRVRFDISLYNEHGSFIGIKQNLSLGTNQSQEYVLTDLFPSLPNSFIGSVYIDYHNLRQTGSLRPYCVLLHNKQDGHFLGRWHYHDKYTTVNYQGFFHNTHPFEPGQTCYMALVNCQERAYRSWIRLRVGNKERKKLLTIPPLGTRWQTIDECFGYRPRRGTQTSLVWLDNPQHVMVWYFWHDKKNNLWIGQHH